MVPRGRPFILFFLVRFTLRRRILDICSIALHYRFPPCLNCTLNNLLSCSYLRTFVSPICISGSAAKRIQYFES